METADGSHFGVKPLRCYSAKSGHTLAKNSSKTGIKVEISKNL